MLISPYDNIYLAFIVMGKIYCSPHITEITIIPLHVPYHALLTVVELLTINV